MSTYFLEQGRRAGGSDLALRFSLPRFIVEGLTIEKRVTVYLSVNAGDSNHALSIAWQPTGSGPLPGFEGTLSAMPQADDTSALIISGSYTPPGGFAGKIFDELIGVRIANATLAALLAQFKSAIEADYRARS
jgi:hypothetical protein